uniref:Integrase catalytic domain-containing protein n=1 Tax=Vitis vinifera TaxID=29760 RepID=A5BFM9_VITVI|nr:hypothetical protein VITISV_001696 [Vitis vinifera]
MTFDFRQVSPLRLSSQKIVSTANSNTTPIIGEGSLILTDTLNLDSILVVPSLNYNILSVSQITAVLSCIVIFWPEFCVFKDIKQNRRLVVSKDSNKLRQALMADGSEGEKKKSEIWLWHRRLGHASFGYLKKLFPSLFSKNDISGFRCDICELAKSHRASFPLILNKSPSPFMVIHSDVWGPSKVPTLSGSRWFVTFIDDCTRMTWLCLMKTKDEVNLLFQNFHKMIETQYNAKVRVLHSDNGGEYQSSDLQKYLEGHDIIHQTTCSNTPQQNGVVERKIWHLLEREAITSATYLINRVPSNSINLQTPFQALTNAIVAPTIPNLLPRVFGCVAFVHLYKHQHTKLTSHALQCVFVGYALHKKGYRCYHPPTRRMFITMDVEAGGLDMSGQQFGSKDVFTEIPNQSSSVESIPKPTYEPELSTKVKYPMRNYVSNHRLSESNKSFVNQLSTVVIPNSMQKALADPRWKATMNEEMKSLQKNETWELVECPPRKKPVGCRWIYIVKYKADDSIERFKARLVAKEYTQTYGIDYTKTFTPVAKINTVRVLLSLAANLDWSLQQFDVKNAFLHGEMHGVRKAMSEGMQIEEVIVWSMRAFGYRQSNSDHTLFLKKQHGKIMALIVYVDDMVVTGNDPEERKTLQNYLSREFEMKDLGPLKYFLGIEEIGMSGCQPVNTPIEEGLKLCVKSNQVSTDKGRYQRLVRRLMYLAHTRPDFSYALSVVSQYMHNPGEQHMNAVMRILRYLKNAPGKGILFAKNVDHQSIEVYTDADWAGAVDDRRSTSGYFTFVGGNLVTWKSKKQNVVTRSSAKAEFRGMALGLCETLWLRLLLQDLGHLSRQPIRLFCDNKVACDIAHNPVQQDHTKHVEVNRFFIKEKLDDKIVELPKIRSEYELADILTKAVSSQVFSKFLDKLGMCDIYALT